jgi:exodeoxyribonuclease VII small subunit
VTEKKPSTKRTPAKKLSFGEAVSEVEQILAGLEQDEIDIDRLSEEVRRAVELIQVCREKLEKTDTEVRDLVAGLQPSGPDEEPTGESGEGLPI